MDLSVSIHAPLRGATGGGGVSGSRCPAFQSTHPCGVRPRCHTRRRQARTVSIHAPLRGATLQVAAEGMSADGFNPRTPAGCDGDREPRAAIIIRFQSTHPCGVRRHVDHPPVLLRQCFNPRTPAGCDGGRRRMRDLTIGFQSTHPCGVRRRKKKNEGSHYRVSIHAPLRGATELGYYTNFWIDTFQSTHPCGVRQGGRGNKRN